MSWTLFSIHLLSSRFLCVSLQFVRFLSLRLSLCSVFTLLCCSALLIVFISISPWPSLVSLPLSTCNFFIYCLWNFIILTQGVYALCTLPPTSEIIQSLLSSLSPSERNERALICEWVRESASAHAREHFREEKRSEAIKDLCIKMKKFFSLRVYIVHRIHF